MHGDAIKMVAVLFEHEGFRALGDDGFWRQDDLVRPGLSQRNLDIHALARTELPRNKAVTVVRLVARKFAWKAEIEPQRSRLSIDLVGDIEHFQAEGGGLSSITLSLGIHLKEPRVARGLNESCRVVFERLTFDIQQAVVCQNTERLAGGDGLPSFHKDPLDVI